VIVCVLNFSNLDFYISLALTLIVITAPLNQRGLYFISWFKYRLNIIYAVRGIFFPKCLFLPFYSSLTMMNIKFLLKMWSIKDVIVNEVLIKEK